MKKREIEDERKVIASENKFVCFNNIRNHFCPMLKSGEKRTKKSHWEWSLTGHC